MVEMLLGPTPVPVCSMKRGLCQLQLAACGMMTYQVWGSVSAYLVLLHPSCSSKPIAVPTKHCLKYACATLCDFEVSVLLVKHEDALQLQDIFYGLCPQSCAVQPVSILI